MSLTDVVALNPPKPVADLFAFPIKPVLALRFRGDPDWKRLQASSGGNVWKFALAWLNRQDYNTLLELLISSAENKRLVMQNRRGQKRKSTSKVFDESEYKALWIRSTRLSYDMALHCQAWAKDYPHWSPRLLLYEAPALIVAEELIRPGVEGEHGLKVDQAYKTFLSEFFSEAVT